MIFIILSEAIYSVWCNFIKSFSVQNQNMSKDKLNMGQNDQIVQYEKGNSSKQVQEETYQ